MSDAVEVVNGEAFMASHRDIPWHGLGTVFQTATKSFKQILKLAHLDGWNVRLVPLADIAPGFVWPKDSQNRPIDQAIVRTNPITGDFDVLGLASRKYGVVQNEQALKFLETLRGGLSWETAGSLFGGKLVFGSLAFDEASVIDPKGVADRIERYLLVSTSHDGSRPLSGGLTGVRVVCKNTLDAAQGDLSSTFKIRHSGNVAEAMEVQAKVMEDARVYWSEFDKEAEKLFQTPMSTPKFVDAFTLLFPKPDKDAKGAEAKWESRREANMMAWNGKANAGIKSTAWGGYNALTEALQWNRRTRGSDANGEPTAKAQESFAAAGAGFDRVARATRADALAVVRAV
jgi:phage/plasmid-like protein (TIGR03299 family)